MSLICRYYVAIMSKAVITFVKKKTELSLKLNPFSLPMPITKKPVVP